jgi:hypothetical protein
VTEARSFTGSGRGGSLTGILETGADPAAISAASDRAERVLVVGHHRRLAMDMAGSLTLPLLRPDAPV